MKPPAAMSASVENDMTGKLNPSFAAMMTPPITVAAVPRMEPPGLHRKLLPPQSSTTRRAEHRTTEVRIRQVE